MSNKIGVSFKLDVTKIDKARLFKGGKGTYLDFTGFIDLDELDQYGYSGFISQDVTKEEREKGVKGAILGNSKVFWKGEGNKQQGNGQQQQAYNQPQQMQQHPQQQGGAVSVNNDGSFADDDSMPF